MNKADIFGYLNKQGNESLKIIQSKNQEEVK